MDVINMNKAGHYLSEIQKFHEKYDETELEGEDLDYLILVGIRYNSPLISKPHVVEFVYNLRKFKSMYLDMVINDENRLNILGVKRALKYFHNYQPKPMSDYRAEGAASVRSLPPGIHVDVSAILRALSAIRPGKYDERTIRIVGDNSGISLSSLNSNNEVVTTSLPIASDSDTFECFVNYDNLVSILKSNDANERISISASFDIEWRYRKYSYWSTKRVDMLVISSLDNRARLIVNTKLWPNGVDEISNDFSDIISMAQDRHAEFGKIIKVLLKHTTKERLKLYHGGIHIKFSHENDTITMMSTDGHRLAEYVLDETPNMDLSVFLSYADLKRIDKFIVSSKKYNGDGSPLQISYNGESHLKFLIGNEYIVIKVEFDIDLPNYQDVLPSTPLDNKIIFMNGKKLPGRDKRYDWRDFRSILTSYKKTLKAVKADTPVVKISTGAGNFVAGFSIEYNTTKKSIEQSTDWYRSGVYCNSSINIYAILDHLLALPITSCLEFDEQYIVAHQNADWYVGKIFIIPVKIN